jgi:hypothetical protein
MPLRTGVACRIGGRDALRREPVVDREEET